MGNPASRAGWDDAVRNTARLAALRRTGMLDSPPEEAFDRLTRLATSVLSVRGAFVSLVDEDRQFFKSSVGVPEPWASLRQTPLTHSFCKHAVASGEPLLISDSRQTPLVRDNPGVTELRLVAYAGIPLKTTEGHTLGAFCVMHDRPHAWTDGEVEVLRCLAASAMAEIGMRQLAADLQHLVEARTSELVGSSRANWTNPCASGGRTSARIATRPAKTPAIATTAAMGRGMMRSRASTTGSRVYAIRPPTAKGSRAGQVPTIAPVTPAATTVVSPARARVCGVIDRTRARTKAHWRAAFASR